MEIGGSTVGGYDVFQTDYATPWTDESVYDFGTATSGGTDPGGLQGATVTDFALYPSFNAATDQEPPPGVTAALDNLHVVFGNGVEDNVLSTVSGTYFSVDDPGVGSALWFEAPGSADASLLWSGLADTSAALAAVEGLSSVLPPDVWFPGIGSSRARRFGTCTAAGLSAATSLRPRNAGAPCLTSLNSGSTSPFMVGVAGFEPTTSSSRTTATRERWAAWASDG